MRSAAHLAARRSNRTNTLRVPSVGVSREWHEVNKNYRRYSPCRAKNANAQEVRRGRLTYFGRVIRNLCAMLFPFDLFSCEDVADRAND